MVLKTLDVIVWSVDRVHVLLGVMATMTDTAAHML